jgi:endonuclease G
VKRLVPLLLGLLVAASALPAQPPTNPNLRFGMPAQADAKNREAFLIERPQYGLSYNATTRTPNWVCWRLRKEDIGAAARGAFMPDPALKGIAKVTSGVYTGGGFDRGHMCPAKDRSATQADCDATFYTTNIVPQSPASNQKGWERLEAYCRDLTKKGQVLYIACGPHGVGGEGKEGQATEIGKGKLKVTVPNKLWKVILVLPSEDAQPRKNSRVIAVIMPNNQSVDFNWAEYRVSAQAVEELTGCRFFRNVPADTAAALRASVDEVQVKVPKSKGL